MLLVLRQELLLHDHALRVNARRHMLIGDALLLKNLQKTATETDLTVHQVLLDDDVAETVRRGDADDRPRRHTPRLLDHRARLRRMVGVADVDRNPGLHRRNDRLVGEDAEAGIRELAHLAVGHRRNALTLLHVLHDPRIARIDRVDVREVLIDVSPHRRCQNGARDVRPAARKCRDLALLRIAEEARIDDDAVEVGKRLRELVVAHRIERRVAELSLQDHTRVLRARIPRLLAARLERHRHKLRVVVLARGFQEIHELGRFELGDLLETRDEIGLDELDDFVAELQLRRHLRIARNHLGKRRVGLLAVQRRLRERNQKIRDLRVVLVALARRRNDHNPPRRIREDDVNDLVELRRIRQRRPAEFANLHLLSPI